MKKRNMKEKEKYKDELVHKSDMGDKKIFFERSFEGSPEKIYPLRNDLKVFINKIPKDEEIVGIVYDGSFTLEILTAKKEIR
jgi:hypothetical protein|tara:strand:- start:337 stop:582 length:246 start_codon:yes stop_codon:yes gene_type:complete